MTATLSPSVQSYTPLLLYLYDKIVLYFNMGYAWKCSTPKSLFPLFSENFSSNHLDIGVATGYFPATALGSFVDKRQRKQQYLTLVDLDANSLHVATHRVMSRAPDTEVTCIQADATAPTPDVLREKRFKSISMMNILHCIPRPTSTKAAALRNYAPLLDDDGVFFGSTVLGYDCEVAKKLDRSWFCYFYMMFINWYGHFDNWEDGTEVVHDALREVFEEVDTWIVGSILLFKARKPIRQ